LSVENEAKLSARDDGEVGDYCSLSCYATPSSMITLHSLMIVTAHYRTMHALSISSATNDDYFS